ncbi:hypothetical protein FQA39_LY02431 [Lamprigera yunnana]|nr:hypothetical protein FQA39_LY02431 [Lamprigera yunnana]
MASNKKKWGNDLTKLLVSLYEYNPFCISGAGAEDANTPTWWLYESLQFLTPYYKKDKGKSNLNNQAIPEIDENEFELESNTTDTDTFSAENLSEGVYTIDSGGILSPSSSTASIARVNSSLTHKDGQRSKQQRNNKRKRVSNATTLVSEAIEKIVNEESDLPADIASFCNYVGHELLTVKHKDVLTSCKREILSVIQRSQDIDNEY